MRLAGTPYPSSLPWLLPVVASSARRTRSHASYSSTYTWSTPAFKTACWWLWLREGVISTCQGVVALLQSVLVLDGAARNQGNRRARGKTPAAQDVHSATFHTCKLSQAVANPHQRTVQGRTCQECPQLQQKCHLRYAKESESSSEALEGFSYASVRSHTSKIRTSRRDTACSAVVPSYCVRIYRDQLVRTTQNTRHCTLMIHHRTGPTSAIRAFSYLIADTVSTATATTATELREQC